jgi:hypothetical protein
MKTLHSESVVASVLESNRENSVGKRDKKKYWKRVSRENGKGVLIREKFHKRLSCNITVNFANFNYCVIFKFQVSERLSIASQGRGASKWREIHAILAS